MKYVHSWGSKLAYNGNCVTLLGQKAANLDAMVRLGLPVPPGFTITTQACTYYHAHARVLAKALQAQMHAAIAKIEKSVGRKFGGTKGIPLLVSVRSGSRAPMPGLMNAVLNLGLNDQSVLALEESTGDPRFAWDCYRRFIRTYGDAVLGTRPRMGDEYGPFELASLELKKERARGDMGGSDLTAQDLRELVKRFKEVVVERTGKPFPQDPWEQLGAAVATVFDSWKSASALVYRRRYGIPFEAGIAASVQSMVFPNNGKTSCSGIAFTRNPVSGVNEIYGEFVRQALYEDVDGEVLKPEALAVLETEMPETYAGLLAIRPILENHFKDVQAVEFVAENGQLFLLQTRTCRRTVNAALRTAVEMVREKLIDAETAVLRIPAEGVDHVWAPLLDPVEVANGTPLAAGFPASPGAACGKLYLNADRAVEASEKGEKVILVRRFLENDECRGMICAEGIICAYSSPWLEAGIALHKMGKPCICRVDKLQLDFKTQTVTLGGRTFQEGDLLSMDGASGKIYAGRMNVVPSEVFAAIELCDKTARSTEKFLAFNQLMQWCSQFARLQVRASILNSGDINFARGVGATGVGLISDRAHVLRCESFRRFAPNDPFGNQRCACHCPG